MIGWAIGKTGRKDRKMIEVGFRCDKCGIGFHFEVSSLDCYPVKRDMIRNARYLGFTVGKRILCPDCNGKPNKRKEEYEKLKMRGSEELDKILRAF